MYIMNRDIELRGITETLLNFSIECPVWCILL